MKRSLTLAVVALFAARLAAGPMEHELDLTTDIRKFDTHFGRYGYVPHKTIILEPKGIRIYLPEGRKGVGQTMLYSYFALAGDFEVSAMYQLAWLAPPQEGYGVSFGMGFDTDGPGGSVAFVRGHQLGKGEGYVVSRGLPAPGGPLKWDDVVHVKTKSKHGRLVVRRDGKNLVCLAADNGPEPLVEICKLEFTPATVRKLRIYADPGGSPTLIDVRLGGLTIKAEEVTGAIPQRDRATSWVWWIVAAVLAVAGGAATWMIWRRRRRDEDDE